MKTDQFSSMNDIIFEKRNKRYGAYELRMNYHRRLIKSFVVASVAMISVFLISRYTKEVVVIDLSKINPDSVVFTTPFVVDQFTTPKPPEKLTPPPAQVQPPDPNSFVAVNDTTPEPVDTSSQLASANPISTVTGTGSIGTSDTIIPNAGPPAGLTVHNTSTVDKIPEFPGGIEKFYAYLMTKIHYTNSARGMEVKGRMYAKFIVDEEGFITNVTIVKSLGYGLDEQVAKVLGDSPKWSPGIARNSPVKTEMILPVNFNLQ
jgi:protein TonB